MFPSRGRAAALVSLNSCQAQRTSQQRGPAPVTEINEGGWSDGAAAFKHLTETMMLVVIKGNQKKGTRTRAESWVTQLQD